MLLPGSSVTFGVIILSWVREKGGGSFCWGGGKSTNFIRRGGGGGKQERGTFCLDSFTYIKYIKTLSEQNLSKFSHRKLFHRTLYLYKTQQILTQKTLFIYFQICIRCIYVMYQCIMYNVLYIYVYDYHTQLTRFYLRVP